MPIEQTFEDVESTEEAGLSYCTLYDQKHPCCKGSPLGRLFDEHNGCGAGHDGDSLIFSSSLDTLHKRSLKLPSLGNRASKLQCQHAQTLD